MNTDSSMWNFHFRQYVNSCSFKELIKSYELIINHDTDFPICPSSLGILIIDLTHTNLDLDPI